MRRLNFSVQQTKHNSNTKILPTIMVGIFYSLISLALIMILKTVKAIIPTVSAVSMKPKRRKAFAMLRIVLTSFPIFIPP